PPRRCPMGQPRRAVGPPPARLTNQTPPTTPRTGRPRPPVRLRRDAARPDSRRTASDPGPRRAPPAVLVQPPPCLETGSTRVPHRRTRATHPPLPPRRRPAPVPRHPRCPPITRPPTPASPPTALHPRGRDDTRTRKAGKSWRVRRNGAGNAVGPPGHPGG